MTVAERLLAGRYRLEEKVAVGGMGTVWRATDEMLGRRVAVKLLHEGLSADPIAAERFRREAHAAASLSHPNMANVYDYVEDDGRTAIVMEFVQGETLAERITREGALPIEESARIAAAVLDALGPAHGAGIVHRDVKPANILLPSGGGVKLTDLGIAHVPGADGLTQTGTLMATPHYVAPEMLRGEPVTPAADLFAVGAVLYEMLTGDRPYDGDTPVAVAMARLNVEPPLPTRLRPGIPAALERVVVRALASRPDARYADAASMRDALEAAASAPTATMLLEHDMAVTQPTPRAAPPAIAPPRSRRRISMPSIPPRRVALLAAITLAIALLVTLAVAMSRPSSFELPDLTTQSLEDARAIADDLGLDLDVRREPGIPPAELVLEQDPGPGAIIEAGDTVAVVVSDGSMRRMPTLVGETLPLARARLERHGLTVGTVRYAETTGVAPGIVISQDPVRLEVVEAGTEVNLVVAREPPPPDEDGKDEGDDRKGPGKGKDRDD
ncbi:MAG TPA: protein kinase [Actinomycetota bacterium]